MINKYKNNIFSLKYIPLKPNSKARWGTKACIRLSLDTVHDNVPASAASTRPNRTNKLCYYHTNYLRFQMRVLICSLYLDRTRYYLTMFFFLHLYRLN